jgi:hypothetical protein
MPELGVFGCWVVEGYYNDTVVHPKRPGDLALRVEFKARYSEKVDWQAALEKTVFEGRKDIGEVRLYFRNKGDHHA